MISVDCHMNRKLVVEQLLLQQNSLSCVQMSICVRATRSSGFVLVYFKTDWAIIQVDAFVSMFKALADEKKEVTDADIEAIMNAEAYQDDVPTWTLNSVHVTAGNRVAPTATVSMEHKDGVCNP